jgi:uncharacterized protein (TIGR02594 family)
MGFIENLKMAVLSLFPSAKPKPSGGSQSMSRTLNDYLINMYQKPTVNLNNRCLPVTPKWYQLAIQEMGVAEVPRGTNPRIVEYFKSTDLKASDDDVPWCAAFVGWCLDRAGVKPSGRALARSYMTWGQSVAVPYEGCIAVLERGEPWQGHVGFYVREHVDYVILLGGNQGNCVSLAKYPKAQVLGYREPLNYSRVDTETKS